MLRQMLRTKDDGPKTQKPKKPVDLQQYNMFMTKMALYKKPWMPVSDYATWNI